MKIGAKYATRNASNDDNMVPLINVVFLMLVFFIVAGQIQKADPVAVISPQSINDNRAVTDPNIDIVLGVDNCLYIDGKQFTSAADENGFWVQIKADGDISLEKLRPIFN